MIFINTNLKKIPAYTCLLGALLTLSGCNTSIDDLDDYFAF